MNKILSSLALTALLISPCLAHEGHDHEGLSKNETQKQVNEGKLCFAKNIGHSLGTVIEQEGKLFRCVKAYGENVQPQTKLIWVEVMLKDKALVTLP